MKEYSWVFIKQLLHKDKNAFNQFYLDSVDMFFRYLKSNYFLSDEDTQDLLSTFYLKVWNALDAYNEKSAFKSWLWTILKNTAKDYFKQKKLYWFTDVQTGWEEPFEDTISSDEENALDILEKDYAVQKIQSAMAQLEEKYKEIIFLKFVEEKTNEELVEVLWISYDNVRSRLSRAIKMLKSLLE